MREKVNRLVSWENHSTALEAWKNCDFVNTGEIFYNYKSARAFYHSGLRNVLNEKGGRVVEGVLTLNHCYDINSSGLQFLPPCQSLTKLIKWLKCLK